MKLKYTGPKEIISSHGIDFKSGKDDKYVYIQSAIQIYYAIHHDYKKDKIYSHKIKNEHLSDEEILKRVISLEPNLKNICLLEINKFEKLLDTEIEETKTHKELNKIEQDALKSNLIIMKKYRLQRETNKIIYNHLIKTIVDDIFEHKLKEINIPFNTSFWHVLQSIQGELSNHEKRSIASTLNILHKEESIFVSLKINSIS